MTAITSAAVDTPLVAGETSPDRDVPVETPEPVDPVPSTRRIAESVTLGVLVAAPVFLVVSGDPSTWKRGVILQIVDLLLVSLALLRVPTIVMRVRAERRSVSAALLTVLAALGVALAVNPSAMGLMTVLRFAGAISAVDVLARSNPAFRSLAARVWLGWTMFEAAVVVAQKGLGRAIGVPGEVGIPFETLGTYPVPTGTSYGPHPIAAMGLVAIGLAVFGTHHGLLSRRWAVCGGAAGAVIIGVTCGTSGALSLVAVFVAGIVRLVRQHRRPSSDTPTSTSEPTSKAPGVAPVLLAVAVAFGIAAAFSIEGWTFKAERTATTDVSAASNGRAGMIDEAVEMIRRWPIVGVGPGRFLATRDAHPDIKVLASEDQAVHNVALLIVTESGALGAVALIIVALAVARRVRTKPYALTLLAAMLGHTLFDHAPWTFGFGMVQLALVLGFATSEGGLTGPVRATTQLSAT